MFKEAESRPDKIESTSNNVQVRKKQQHRRRACDLLVICHLTLNCSSAFCLELLVSFLLELRLVTLKIWFRTSLVEVFGPWKNRRTTPFCPGPRAVLNDDEGGLCLWPPGVCAVYLLFSEPFPWFRVKMLTQFEDFLEL